MILPLVLGLTLQSAAEGRLDNAVRLVQLDAAWMQTPNPERRAAAVPEIANAVTAFFANRPGEASRALDAARRALRSEAADPLDAVTLVPFPRLIDATETPRVVARLAYGETDARVEGRTVTRSASEPIPVERDDEGGAWVTLTTGSQESKRRVPFYSAENLEARLKEIDRDETRRIAQYLREIRESPELAIAPTDDLAFLLAAERVRASDDPRERLRLPLVEHQGVTFRLAAPDEIPKGPLTVVVALHGAGGNEHMFMDSLGGGLAQREALRRGWVFASPQSRPNAPAAVLDWIRSVAKAEVSRVFLMGHSAGGGAALQASATEPPPAALALFAPAAPAIPSRWDSTPIFLAVGAQEMMMLRNMAGRLGATLEARTGNDYRVYENSEHLMIVADALPDAFRFFDRITGTHRP